MNKILKLNVIVFTLLMGLSFTANSQTSEDLAFNDWGHRLGSNGSAASEILNKNLFNGNINVNIPLYKYSVEGVDLGVTMNYTTSGLLVDELPSNVGLGWELNTGSSVMRQIRGGRNDENGYWFGTTIDKENDIYYFIINNRFIKVMFAQGMDAFITIPSCDIKINRKIGGVPITFPGPMSGDLTFEVIDEMGNRYYFIKQKVTGSIIEQWALEKVVTYEGKQVLYSYLTPITEHLQVGVSQITSIRHTPLADAGTCTGFTDYSVSTADIGVRRLDKISYPNGVDVQFVYSSTNRCDIPEDNISNEIKIKERNSPSGITPASYSYKFNFSYFLSPDYHTPIVPSSYTTSASSDVPISSCSGSIRKTRYRLKLNSIDIAGFDAFSTRRYYTFEYNPVPLPERIFGGSDRYGYANGTAPGSYTNPKCEGEMENHWLYGWGPDGCVCWVPDTDPSRTHDVYTQLETIGTASVGMYREIGTVGLIQSSSLTKITNQKGGSISFTYKSLNDPSIAVACGGLAIDKIVESDGYSAGNDVTTRYSYSNTSKFFATEGFGKIWDELIYTQACDEDLGSTGSGTYWPVFYNQTYKRYANNFNLINTALDKNRYGLNTVEESLFDASLNLLKRTVYNFSGLTGNLYTPSFSDPSPDFNQPFSFRAGNKQFTRDWGVGLLTNVKYYDNNNNIIREEDNNYNITSNYISSLSYKNVHGTTDVYYPFTGKTQLVYKSIKEYYSNSGYLSTGTTYNYDVKGNVSHTEFLSSKNELIHNNYFYNYNYTSSSPAINKMNADGIERLIYVDKVKSVGTSSYRLIGLNLNTPYVVGGNIIRPKYNYVLRSASSPLPSSSGIDIPSMSSGLDVSNFYRTATATKFDDLGNVLETSDMRGVGGNNYAASIIDNQTGDVLAEAQNAAHGEISYCGFESDYSNPSPYVKGNWGFNPVAISTTHKLLGRCSFHHSSTYGIYSSGNLVVGKKYTVSFWRYNEPGSVSVNDGITPITLSVAGTYTSPATGEVWTFYKCTFTAAAANIGMWGDGYVDELKLYPANSIMKTHNYIPLVGKTADVDQNDNFTTYEYDAFGNPTVIRDQNGDILSKTQTVIQGY